MSTDALANGWGRALGGDRKQFDMFFDKMLDGFAYHKIVVDKAGKPIDYVFLEINHAFEEMTGLKREHIIGKKVTDTLPGIERDPAGWIGVYGKVALTGEPVQFENYNEALCKWFKVVAYSPEKGYFAALFEDISERRKTEEKLRAGEERYRHLVQYAPTAIYEIDFVNQRFKSVNDAMCVMSRYNRDELLAMNPLDNLVPESQIRFKQRIGKALAGERIDENVEYKAIAKDGREFWVTLNMKLLGKEGRFYGAQVVAHDITERKKAEDALRLSEVHYRTLFSSIGEGFELMELIFDENKAVYDLRYLEVNDTYEKQTGLKAKDVLGKTVRELFPKIEGMWIDVFDKVTKAGVPTRLEDYHKDTNRYYSAYYFPFGKKEVGVLFSDITEVKKAEEAVARQAELIDLSPDAIIVRKLDGTITFWSKGAETLYGLTKEEAIGQDINTLLKTEFPQPLEKILKTLKLDGKWSGEIVHTCKNGDRLVVQSFWLAKFGADGKIFEMLESNVDITQRIELQAKLEESAVRVEEYANQMEELANKRADQLKDAERLAAIGATAGMVGHDIRNPLQAITGDVFLAKTDLIAIPESDEKNSIQESLSEIEKNIDYINKIVADLQDFARPLKPKIEETDLKLIINELLKKNGLPENVKVTVKIEPDARKVVADSTFINRIMYNLVTNAVQAMPKGGKLTIRTYKEAKDVIIAVKDTGVGIPETVKGKLFTPMFTTKSKGQGFGLAVIKRMTEALGGTVSFESQEGKGTTFTVRLPST